MHKRNVIVPDKRAPITIQLSEVSNRIVVKILQLTIWYHVPFFFRYVWFTNIVVIKDSLVQRRSTECQLCEDKINGPMSTN